MKCRQIVKYLYLISFVVFFKHNVYAQKEAYNWFVSTQFICNFDSGYFKYYGKFNYLLGPNGNCISDTSGKIQFYLNSDKILQENSNTMPNGAGIYFANVRSQNQILTHPNQDSQSMYFVLVNTTTNGANNIKRGVFYSVVDMNLNSGMGDVVAGRKNIRLGDTLEFNEGLGLGLAKHSNNKDWWVIVAKNHSDSIYAYLFDENGIIGNPVISVLKKNKLRGINELQIKVSSKNDKVVITSPSDSSVFFWQFDNRFGHFKSQINIPAINCISSEFSYSGDRLYLTCQNTKLLNPIDTLFQYDVSIHDSIAIAQSKYAIDSFNSINSNLQLGPDRKIYFTSNTFNINVIEEPEIKGAGCSARVTNVKMGDKFTSTPQICLAYPWYYSSSRLFTDSLVCLRDSTELRFFHNDFIDSFHVYYDDGSFSRHDKNESFVYYAYQTPGQYRPMVLQYYKDYIDTFYTHLTVVQNKPDLGADLHFCQDYQIVLKTSDDFVSHDWNGRSNSDSLILKDSSYQIILKTVSQNACKDSDTLNIVRTWIQQEIELNDSVFCFEDLMVLGKQKINILNDTLKSRQWLLDGLLLGQADSVLITFLNAGLHTLKIIAITDSMCKDSVKVNVNVLPFPKVKIHVNDSAQCLNGNAFEFKSIGMLQNIWIGDEGVNSQDSIVNKSYVQAGIYKIKLQAKDSMQCSGEDSFLVRVHLPQNNEIQSNKDTFCVGEQMFFKTKYKSSNVQWNMIDTGNQVSYACNDSGNYKVTMKSSDSNGCVSNDTLHFRVGRLPEVAIEVEQKACSQEFTLKENLNQADSRFWLYDNKSINTFPLTLMLEQATDTVYLIVTSLEGCSDTIETILKIQFQNQIELKIPNVFTPDGDEINDCYTIEGLNSDCGDEAMLDVYNRWGELVFKGNLSKTCWNGNLMNQNIECSAGTYYCIIKLIKGTEQKIISTTLLLIR